MKFYKEICGDDIDGNRGTSIINYEIEKSDTDEIVDKLYDRFKEGWSQGETIIEFYCPLIDDDIQIEVNIDDYLKELIAKAEQDDDYLKDDDFTEYVRELRQELENAKQ